MKQFQTVERPSSMDKKQVQQNTPTRNHMGDEWFDASGRYQAINTRRKRNAPRNNSKMKLRCFDAAGDYKILRSSRRTSVPSVPTISSVPLMQSMQSMQSKEILPHQFLLQQIRAEQLMTTCYQYVRRFEQIEVDNGVYERFDFENVSVRCHSILQTISHCTIAIDVQNDALPTNIDEYLSKIRAESEMH